MPSLIQYSFINHRGLKRIAIHFEYNKEWNERIGKVPGAKWSKTLQCWHIPDTLENRRKCGFTQIGKAVIKQVEVKAGLQPYMQTSKTALGFISANNKDQLQQFLQQLQLKAYSPSTIRTYRNEFSAFLQTLGKHAAEKLTVQRIKDYLQYCHTQLKLSENSIHSRMNALKFYYEQVLGREKFFWEIPRPKKPMILPKVLGEGELRKLFNAIRYKKHKAILFTAYSAGLRVSEVVNLQLKHIDRSRMQLLIEKSKGKKDRYVGLSPLLLDILENYYKEINPKPVKYLFEGQYRGTPYNARSAQKVFQMAKEKAAIKKEIGFHSLRHSFATHLLEKGIDIKYIKDLLGHFDIHTTERYLHVKKDKLINIISPFDDLWQKENIDW
jgi:integrase/recombinase XerD